MDLVTKTSRCLSSTAWWWTQERTSIRPRIRRTVTVCCHIARPISWGAPSSRHTMHTTTVNLPKDDTTWRRQMTLQGSPAVGYVAYLRTYFFIIDVNFIVIKITFTHYFFILTKYNSELFLFTGWWRNQFYYYELHE